MVLKAKRTLAAEIAIRNTEEAISKMFSTTERVRYKPSCLSIITWCLCNVITVRFTLAGTASLRDGATLTFQSPKSSRGVRDTSVYTTGGWVGKLVISCVLCD